METRPLSATKRFRLVEVVEKRLLFNNYFGTTISEGGNLSDPTRKSYESC